MGHGTVADEIKGRAPQSAGERAGAILAIAEEGVRFRSYLDGGDAVHGPETSMEVQAALGSDIALVFDECTPFHVDPRLHRALDRAHPPLAGPLPGLARRARPGRPGRLRDRAGRGGRGPAPRVRAGGRRARRRAGSPSAARWAQDKAQMYEVVEWAIDELPDGSARGTCSASARSTTSCAASSSASTRSTARCRPASAATAWRSCPTRSAAGAWTWPRRRWREADEPLLEGCPCPACARGYSRAYLHYLLRAREPTGSAAADDPQPRLPAAADGGPARAIAAGRLAEAAAAARAGAAPWELDAAH